MFVLLPDGHEVLGAGLATCLSNCVALPVLPGACWLRMGRGSVITFSPRVGLPCRDSIVAVFGVGVPSAIATFLFDLDYVIIDKLMVSYDDLALAAVGIVLKVERFPLNVGIGICQGMMPLVAYNYSAGNKQRMEDTIRLARRLGLTIAAISIALYELFAVQFAHLFIARRPDGGAGLPVPAHPGAGHAADVFELFHRLPLPGLWKGADLPVPGGDPVAGVQHPHAVFAQRASLGCWASSGPRPRRTP